MAGDWNDTILSEPQELATHTQIPSTTTDGSNLISFPTEIYESILDELVEWPETLRACAPVSHLFAQLAQKLLFSCICLKRPTRVVNPAPGEKLYVQPSIGFFRVLSSSPHLAGYVKSLIVSDADSFKYANTYREHRSWIRSSSDHAVHQILPLLANLEELGLAGNTRDSRLDFLAWGSDLRMGILERCSSDRLVKIRLAYVRNVPFSLLVLAPRLETLRLKNVLFISDLDHTTFGRAVDLQERHPPARLKHVSVTSTDAEEWSACYAWLASHLDLTHIKTLELNIDFYDEDEEMVEEARQAILNLLSGCSATLETLRLFMPDLEELTLSSPNRPRPFEFDVRALPVLRNLQLSSWIWYAGQSTGIHTTMSSAAAAPLPLSALHTLTSIISQTLPPNTRDEGEHDRGSSSSSYPPHTQLEALTIQLVIHDYLGMSSSRLGWEEFARVVEALAAVGRMSLESEREAIQVDFRPMMGWETMLGEVYRRSVWESVFEFVRSGTGATLVVVVASLLGKSDDLVEGLLEEKLGWLREKGVGLVIHAEE